MEINDLIKELNYVISIDGNDLGLLSTKLTRLEHVKYECTRLLVDFEKELLIGNMEALPFLLSDDKLKKTFNSSTMIKDQLNAKNIEAYTAHKFLTETLRNIRGSIDSTRTQISTEKALCKID